jgi:hypothetical protein
LSSSALLAYLLFVAAAVLLPGIALQRLSRVRLDAALVIPLGGSFCAGAYWLALVLDRPWLFPALLALSALALLLPLGRWQRADGLPSEWRTDFRGQAPLRGQAPFRGQAGLRGAVPPCLGLLALLSLAQFPFNRQAPNGDFVLDPLVPFDSAFHVGLTHELVIGHPPQIPGVAGFPIGYHLGTDLVRAAALRWAGTDPWDSLTRLDVLLWGIALVLALRAVTARLGAPPLAVALVPWTLLLTDFSFVFAANPQAHWWADLLRGNLLLSLAYANPVVPALALALGTLVALSRHLETEERGALLLAGLQALALPFFKVFLGAQLLLGLGVAFLLARGSRRRALALIALPCAIVTAVLVLGRGGETLRVSLAPLDLVAVTRETLGLAPLHGPRLAAWAVPWLLCSLGLRLLGLPESVRSLRSSTVPSVLAAMALSGWPLGLVFRVSAPEVLAGQEFVNDAAYLVEQSGPLLWIFTAIAVARFAATPLRRGVAIAALLLLATPATVQYVVKKATSAPGRLPAAMVRAAAALERVSQPGDVVLQRPGARYPPAPVILAGRRVPYERFTPYLTQFASRQALEQRHEVVYRFFHTRDRDEAIAIARSLDARFLALYGTDRVRFDPTGLLEPVHEEEGARLYRLRLEP